MVRFLKCAVDFGLSPYQRRKIKKVIKYKEDELRGIDYTLSSGMNIIEQQISEMKKDGFHEDNIRTVLSKKSPKTIKPIPSANPIKIEIRKYLI